MIVNNLSDKRYGKLTVTQRCGSDKKGNAFWLCRCDCGKETIAAGYRLTMGHTKSCGCLRSEVTANKNLIHGLSRTRIFRIWSLMKLRCSRMGDINYKNYGARGITVCEEWLADFMNFYEWAMNNGYREGLSIDRIDNNGNYEPSNCRWANRFIQNNNTRKNVVLTAFGKSKTISEWARETGIKAGTLYNRIKMDLCSSEDALTIKENLRTGGKIILNKATKVQYEQA